MFCIVCGKEAEVGNFCKRHYSGIHRLFELKDFTLDVCPDCRNGFPTDEDIEKRIKWHGKCTGIEIKRKAVGNRITINVTGKGATHPGLEKMESHTARITMRKRKCDRCVKKSGGYYEAVFQVRGKNKNRILEKIEKLAGPNDISSVNRLKEGYDIKFISKKKASTIARSFKKRFSVTDSYKLVGQKKDKRLYRSFYAVR